MAASTPNGLSELEMVLEAKEYLLANDGTPGELAAIERAITKYSDPRNLMRYPGAPQHPGRNITPGPNPTISGGRGASLKPSQGQLDMATDLLRRVFPGQEDLVEALRGKTPSEVKKTIDKCLDTLRAEGRPTGRLATEDQKGYIRRLVDLKKPQNARFLLDLLEGEVEGKQASNIIDRLKRMVDAPVVPSVAVSPGNGPQRVEQDGMYRTPEGEIFKVQIAHHGSGNLYAKRLEKLDTPRIVRGKEATFEFIYAPGAIKTLRPEWRMSQEDAQAWGRLYGACCRCGLVLTDEDSIARGMGKDCWSKV